MNVRVPGRLGTPGGQSSIAVMSVELVIASHRYHGFGVQLLANDEAHAFGQALTNVTGNDHDVMRWTRVRQLKRKAPVYVDV